ncbi:MAG TPA: NlpC/P60 family protein, partial [Acidothermaceae bacterium]
MRGRRSAGAVTAVLVTLGMLAGCSTKSNRSQDSRPPQGFALAPSTSLSSAQVGAPSGAYSAPASSLMAAQLETPGGKPSGASSPYALAPQGGKTHRPTTTAAGPIHPGSTQSVHATQQPANPALPALPAQAVVDVSVATLWHSPSSPRSVDAAELRQPAGVQAWLSSMSTAQRLDLNGRVDSQLLLGEQVVVDQRQGTWAHVVVADQPTPLDASGYPGWIHLAQLTFRTPTATSQELVVTSPSAWIYANDDVTQVVDVSMATRLPVLSDNTRWVQSQLPDGRAVSLRAADVALVSPGAGPLAPTADDIVRTAKLFLGLPYLWGGTSGFGFDCSGLTHLVFAMRGLIIPRDADAQARVGEAVDRADLRPGDLVFFASNGVVHHVGIYVGNDTMLSSLQTGSPVEYSSLSAQPFASEYSGARRFVG